MSVRDRLSQVKVKRFCAHANCEVVIKTTYIYPADIMPETAPRINQRSCSHYFTCSLQDKSACTFAIEKINKPHLRVEHSS